MTAAFVILALWATLRLAPHTPVGRFLHRVMVEAPAERLGRIHRRHILVALTLASLGALFAWFGEGDGVRVLGMAAPETWAWLSSVEVSVYVDALAALVAASSAVRVKAVIARLPGVRRPAGTRRTSRGRRSVAATPANDDEDGPGLARAA